jgi:hypothetical protein
VVVRSAAELEWIKDVLSTSKAIKLAEKIDRVNTQTNDSNLWVQHIHILNLRVSVKLLEVLKSTLPECILLLDIS